MNRIGCVVVALVLAGGCLERESAFVPFDARPTFDDCDRAIDLGRSGDPCAFETPCRAFVTPCCVAQASCVDGTLRIEGPPCEGECVLCERDADCGEGRICEGGGCANCPPSTCEECPRPLAPFTRNGCWATCACAPATQCESTCPDGLTCYRGQRCANDACAPECCLNVCAEGGCGFPAPLGCATPCPAGAGCGRCVTVDCTCEGTAWRCGAACDETESTPPCFQP